MPIMMARPDDGSAWQTASGEGRVLRGGSWYIIGRDVRSALRDLNAPGNRFDDIGFRLARD